MQEDPNIVIRIGNIDHSTPAMQEWHARYNFQKVIDDLQDTVDEQERLESYPEVPNWNDYLVPIDNQERIRQFFELS